MKALLKISSILSVALLALLMACKPSGIAPTAMCSKNQGISISTDHPKAAALQAKIDEYIAKGIPGITLLISDEDGTWISSGGYADIENGILMEPCHINKLGSVTKMMMGTLVWMLIEEGKLSIDDPMSKYIPEVSSRITHGDQITLAMLLSHSSGVYDIARDLGFMVAVMNDFARSWSAEEILKYLEGKPSSFAPGTDRSYSNSNTILISMIIEAATGRKHADLLQERIFTPLGMEKTVYYDYSEPFPFEHLAQGYLDFNNDGNSIENISNLNPGSGNGFTGVYSTVVDMYRYAKALAVDYSLISEDNLELILKSMGAIGDGSWQSSIGAIHDEYKYLFSDNQHAYGHAGGDIGYSANLSFLPHNKTIFAATYNYGTNLRTSLGRVQRDLVNDLYRIVGQ